MIKVSEINIYPIKSLGRISQTKISVEKKGLSNDRCFMLVDKNNQFITQRKYPSLALISVTQQNDGLLIHAPNKTDLVVPINNFTKMQESITIWKDVCSTLIADKTINQWFTDYLEFEVSLVAYDNLSPRATDPLFSNENDIVSFADAFPILVISQASLDDLNGRLINPVTMQRFRPNIVVEGCNAFDEDQWRNIKIGDVEFEAVKICSRCILTTIDPKTGIKDQNGEPLKTLSQFRKNISGVKNEKGVFFGMNLIPRSFGKINISDEIVVALDL